MVIVFICWGGIFFVIRDRLDETVNQSNFYHLGKSMTPKDWPRKLSIGKNTLSNLARKINSKDRQEPYYDMMANPFEDLCDTFWNILLTLFLNKKREKMT